MKNILVYLYTLIVFLLLDGLWLGVVARTFYSKHLQSLMKTDVNWYAAGIFYLIFIVGLAAFVIFPALEKKSWLYALQYGAFFGLVTYATYDLTNLATLKNWSLTVTIVDLLWGTFLSATVATVVYFLSQRTGI